MILLSLLLTLIFAVLGALHFHWALGGSFGFSAALPTTSNGTKVLNPKKIHTVIVGLALIACAVFYLLISEVFEYELPQWMIKYIGWTIPALFLLRAIGDFNYVGFFKRKRNTAFGKQDTLFFSPLCLLIGILGIILQLLK